MILVDAVYINNGGGKILLEYFISSYLKNHSRSSLHFLIDKRLNSDLLHSINSTIIDVSSYGRLKFYLKNKKKISKVFCFGNIPPPIKLSCTVLTYFHQAKYISNSSSNNIYEKIKLYLKKVVIKNTIHNSDIYIVQTNRMKFLLSLEYKILDRNIFVIPFFQSNYGLFNVEKELKEKNTYLYVSLAAKHKNHINLINAFITFYDIYNLGTLYLTIDYSNKRLCNLISHLQLKGYPIINLGEITRNELSHYYKKAEYLVYPSLIESFGLGLIEALQFNCKIIAADLEYTYEVCCPSVVFNPSDIMSIVNAFEKTIMDDNIMNSKLLADDKVNELITLILN